MCVFVCTKGHSVLPCVYRVSCSIRGVRVTQELCPNLLKWTSCVRPSVLWGSGSRMSLLPHLSWKKSQLKVSSTIGDSLKSIKSVHDLSRTVWSSFAWLMAISAHHLQSYLCLFNISNLNKNIQMKAFFFSTNWVR